MILPGSWVPSTAGRRRCAGFTLLEVLLSLFIVATTAVLLSEGLVQNLRLIEDDRLQTTLALLAQWKMSEVVAGAISPDIDTAGSFEEEDYPGYEWQIEKMETETPGLSEITVTVRYLPEGASEPVAEFSLHRLLYQSPNTKGEGL